MTLGVLIPVWGRPELSGAVLAYWAGQDCRVTVVCSPEDAAPPEIPAGCRVVEAPNDHLGKKWQAGLDAMDEDAVMIVGSDDLITPRAISMLFAAAVDHNAACPNVCHFADLSTQRAFAARYRTVYAGATYGRRFLDTLRAPLFWHEDHLDINPDSISTRRLRAWQAAEGSRVPPWNNPRRIVNLDPHAGEIVLDIKTGDNIWTYDAMLRRPTKRRTLIDTLPYHELFARFEGYAGPGTHTE